MKEQRGNSFDLTQGSILRKLLLVSLPIMGSQVVQMTYNLTDMFWLGRLSSYAVAASGTVGMYLWLSMAFMTFGSKGAEIGVSQNMGKGDRRTAQQMAQTSVTLNLLLGVAYAVILFLARGPLVSFLKITDPIVARDAQDYLSIVSIGIPFSFVSNAVNGVFVGSGNARTPFYIVLISLVCNMVLDPLFIFPMGMGVHGAAAATTIAQVLGCVLLLVALRWNRGRPFERFRLFCRMQKDHLLQIVRWATPIAVEAFFFTLLSMLITRMTNAFGLDATAATRVGSQVESLSWLLAGGFATALTAFTGQNYGAGKWTRIHRGFRLSSYAMLVWGLAVTAILYFGGGFIFTLFLPDSPEVVQIGIEYLRILAVCQLFQCIEGLAAGAFRGMGQTLYPSIVSFTCNALRVVAAYFFSRWWGLNGIFWAVSLGATLRGIWMYIWYLLAERKMPKKDTASPVLS